MAVALAQDIEEIEFVKRGQVTIPKHLRDEHNITAGQKGALLSIGGAFMIFPRQPETPALFAKLGNELGIADMSLDELVQEMRRVREARENG